MRLSRLFGRNSAHWLGYFVRPPIASRGGAQAIIAVLVGVISVADYLLGTEFSFSMFYLIPISLASGWFGQKAGVVTAIASAIVRLIGDLYTVYPAPLPAYVWWNAGTAFVIFLFVVWLVHTLVSAHNALEGSVAARTSELAESIADRRRLELEIIDVAGRERTAIGRELHDELGQHLVATALAAQVLAQHLRDPEGRKEAQAIVGWIEQGIAKTRKLARGLLLGRIDAERFTGELEELAANASHGGVRCRVLHQGETIAATGAQCAQLFRIAQEALGNALRHARPTNIDVTLASDDQACCLIVADDGKGFQPEQTSTGMGLRIMEHRAHIIGASLAVLSAPGEGTRVICRLPYPDSANP